jgi:hypothetical protein
VALCQATNAVEKNSKFVSCQQAGEAAYKAALADLAAQKGGADYKKALNELSGNTTARSSGAFPNMPSDAAKNALAASAPKIALAIRSAGTSQPAAPKVLIAPDRQQMKSEIAMLKSKVLDDETKASKLDKSVTEEESSIKQVLYTAKKMEKESLKAKDHALKRGTEATKLMKMSAKVKKDGVEAKKEFVAQETPMMKARIHMLTYAHVCSRMLTYAHVC